MKAYRADVAFDGDGFLDGGVLVLTDGSTIVGVERGDAPVAEGVDVEYTPGTTLLPGLIDSHTHLCGDGGPVALDQLGALTEDDLDRIVTASLHQQVAAGVTTVRDLGDRAWFVAQRRAPRPGLPRVLASGPPITSAGGHCAIMGGEVDGAYGTRAAALRTAVTERAERGVDVVKIMASGGVMTPGTDPAAAQFDLGELRAVVEAAHGHGLPVVAHAHAFDAVRHAVAAGADGIEHATCMTAQGPMLPPDLLAHLVTARIAVCPTPGRTSLEMPERTLALMAQFNLTIENLNAHFGAMYEAGVRILGGDDSGIAPHKPHGVLPSAVAEFVAAGMRIADALTTVTGAAADALGLGPVTGHLRRGLAADLLVVPGDLRAGVGGLTAPVAIVVRGEGQAISGKDASG